MEAARREQSRRKDSSQMEGIARKAKIPSDAYVSRPAGSFLPLVLNSPVPYYNNREDELVSDTSGPRDPLDGRELRKDAARSRRGTPPLFLSSFGGKFIDFHLFS